MKRFDLQGIELAVPTATAFGYIADPANLPEWTNAFAQAGGSRAVMRTPSGEVAVDLAVRAAADEGTIDWTITFPDGSVAQAFSRLVPIGEGRCAYAFVLIPPPAPLELLEGTLETQSGILREELARLQALLAGR